MGEVTYFCLRGYNLLTIDPETAAIGTMTIFDTYRGGATFKAFEAHLDSLPWNTIIVGATEGEVGLSGEVVKQLDRFGIRRRPLNSGVHAFIGGKGATPGSVPEVMTQDNHVTLSITTGRNGLTRTESDVDEQLRIRKLERPSSAVTTAYVSSAGQLLRVEAGGT